MDLYAVLVYNAFNLIRFIFDAQIILALTWKFISWKYHPQSNNFRRRSTGRGACFHHESSILMLLLKRFKFSDWSVLHTRNHSGSIKTVRNMLSPWPWIYVLYKWSSLRYLWNSSKWPDTDVCSTKVIISLLSWVFNGNVCFHKETAWW